MAFVQGLKEFGVFDTFQTDSSSYALLFMFVTWTTTIVLTFIYQEIKHRLGFEDHELSDLLTYCFSGCSDLPADATKTNTESDSTDPSPVELLNAKTGKEPGSRAAPSESADDVVPRLPRPSMSTRSEHYYETRSEEVLSTGPRRSISSLRLPASQSRRHLV